MFQDILQFWLNRNVDGFRINSVSYFYEDENLRNEPVVGNGNYTSGLPENANLVYMFRSYIDDWVKKNNATSKYVQTSVQTFYLNLFYDICIKILQLLICRLLIAESYDTDKVLISLYGNDTQDGIPPFNFRFITSVQNTSTAQHIKNVLENWLKILPNNASTNWVVRVHVLQ